MNLSAISMGVPRLNASNNVLISPRYATKRQIIRKNQSLLSSYPHRINSRSPYRVYLNTMANHLPEDFSVDYPVKTLYYQYD